MLSLMTLAGCTGGSGKAPQQITPAPVIPDSSAQAVYTGKVSSPDVGKFVEVFWSNMANRTCGSCHGASGSAPKKFLDGQDMDNAYNTTLSLIDFKNPSASALVKKAETGHNCWAPVASVCAQTITTLITNWGGIATAAASAITFVTPQKIDAGQTLEFPAPAAFGAVDGVYPLLKTYCVGCHSQAALTPQQPYFAGSDLNAAYAAAKQKMNLEDPSKSRFVLRLREQSHNCWNNDCAASAKLMQEAIERLAGKAVRVSLDPKIVASDGVSFQSATVVSTGGRIDSNAIALYKFSEGQGSVAYDTSGVEPALNLKLDGDYLWEGAWGIRLNAALDGQVPNGRAQGMTADSVKLHRQLRAAGEYSMEAWVVPGNVSQDGPARIISYSGGEDKRNFTLGQVMYNYHFYNRDAHAKPTGTLLKTQDADKVLQSTLQHVVSTFHPTDGSKIYVNGELVAQAPKSANPALSNWDETFALVLGREITGEYGWAGTIRMLAIHKTALTAEQVTTNYKVGVGQKFYMLFGITDLTGLPQSFIVFEVQQFDSYSYLFNKPFFLSLDPAVKPNNLHIDGLRIGVNGRESLPGQSFANLNMDIQNADYQPKTGAPLSRLGTLVALEKGQTEDKFFLTFDKIGSKTSQRTADIVPPPAPPTDTAKKSEVGLRNFAEINASLALMTGVATTDVAQTYEQVKQQMPTVEAAEGFLAAHQMGVTQLAVKYCNTMANSHTYRSALFPNLNVNVASFDAAAQTLIVDNLLKALVSHNIDTNANMPLADQPTRDEVDAALNPLFAKMAKCPSDCAKKTLTAACAAALGSAVMLLQ